jgi:hypothetical protein
MLGNHKNDINRFFVINQPKHASAIIVDMGGVNNKAPLPTILHDWLGEAEKDNDLIFLFQNPISINPEKFTTLYQGCMYVIAGENKSYTLLRTFDYIREIFSNHVQVGFIISENITSDENLNCIKRFGDQKVKTLKSSILEINRYNNEEFFKVYKEEKNRFGIYRIYESPSILIRLSLNTIDVMRELPESYYSTFSNQYFKDFIPNAIKYLGLEYIGESL